MEGAIGLAPYVVDIASKTSPTLDELLFGSVVILLINHLVLKHLLGKNVALWRQLVVMLCSDAAFPINTIVKTNFHSIYMPVLCTYALVFFIAYYLLLFKAPGEKVLSKHIWPALSMALFYTFGVIAFEGFWRVFFWAQNLSLLVQGTGVTFTRSFLFAVIFAILAKVLQAAMDKRSNKKEVA